MTKKGDLLFRIFVYLCTFAVVGLMILMLVHIVTESIPAFLGLGTQMFSPETEWRPVSKNAQYGLLPAISGTLYVSALGVLFAVFFGVGCAFFLNYYVPEKAAYVFQSFIDIVAGIPSVIFGFIGLTVLVKYFQDHLHMAAGQCVLAAGIVLGVMLLPFVVSTCSESIRVARKSYETVALSLGFSREWAMLRAVFPAVRISILAAMMMAFGRAIGETMAVMMVIGNSAIFPHLFGRGQTTASLTALEMGSIEYGSMHLSVLYAANFVLLGILILIQLAGHVLKRRVTEDA